MKRVPSWVWVLLGSFAMIVIAIGVPDAQEPKQKGTSYLPVDIRENFTSILARMKAAKP